MIRLHRHGDVVRLEMSSHRSRLLRFSVSAYLVRGVLVDTGFPAVGNEVERLLQSERLRGVIVTHWHEDHAGNIERVASRGLPIAAHLDTLTMTRNPEPLAFYRRFVWGAPAPLVSPVIPFDADDFEMIATPGHSRDHVAVWDPHERSLFSGDLFIGVKVRVAHHDEEPRRLVQSLRRVLALEPRRLFDGHRGLLPDGCSALRAKADWVEEVIERVERLAREGMSQARIAREVLGGRHSSDLISGNEYSRASLVHAILHERT